MACMCGLCAYFACENPMNLGGLSRSVRKVTDSPMFQKKLLDTVANDEWLLMILVASGYFSAQFFLYE